jgi:hypothetical protein
MKTTRQAGAEPAFRAVALSALKTILATNSVACHLGRRAGAAERYFALFHPRSVLIFSRLVGEILWADHSDL